MRGVTILPKGERAFEPEQAALLDAQLPETDWQTIPPEFERGTIRAPSGDLAWIALGEPDAPRVILAPGATGSKEDFLLLMPLLARAGFRTEAFDLAGQYESYTAGPENLAPPEHRYTLKLFTDDLLAVIRAGGAPVHLLGYSYAATVVAAVTAEHPELVSTLTLLSPPPVSGQALRRFKVLGPLSDRVSGAVIGRLLIWGVSRNFNRAPRDRIALVRHRFTLTRRDSVGDIMDLMKRTPDFDEALRESGIPVLIAIGSDDVYPTADHHAYAQRLGADIAVFETGHSPCETAPHQLSAAMLRLFER